MPLASGPLRSTFGLNVFDAQKGHGSFVTASLTKTPATPQAHAYLWVYMCSWKLRVASEEIAHSELPDDVIATAAAALNGRRIEALILHQILAPEGTFHAATLHFSDRASLRMEQYDHSEPEEPIFLIRTGEDHWISYDSDGNTREPPKRPNGPSPAFAFARVETSPLE